MLHDALTLEEVVDSEAALEFMKEATKLATATELEDIGDRLRVKHEAFRDLLASDRLAALDEAGVERLSGMIFGLRRKGRRLVEHNGLEGLRSELGALLYGEETIDQRLDRFLERLGGVDQAKGLAFATECLHFANPRRHWLWTHWIWNPGSGTGALSLVIQDGIDLAAPTAGATYLNVGRATALVDARGHDAGWAWSGPGLFGTDVFLACVYAVFMYTVFRVKLSQEFNRILPELPELVDRVLGVRQLGGDDG